MRVTSVMATALPQSVTAGQQPLEAEPVGKSAYARASLTPGAAAVSPDLP